MHTSNKFLLIALSSCLWFLSLHTFGCCSFLIFFMFTPLFLLVQEQSISFKEGFIWAFIFFGLHFRCFFYAVNCFILPLLLICYMSLIVGIWFLMLATIAARTHYKNLIWFFGFNGLFFFINYGSGFFIEFASGYCLAHPVIALAQIDSLVALTQVLPRELLLGGIVFVSYCMAICIQRHFVRYGFCGLIFIGCFFGISTYCMRAAPGIRIQYVHCATLNNPLDQAASLIDAINTLAPTCDCIVTQESTFPYPIHHYFFIFDWLTTDKDIIFHTHMYVDRALFNVALHIQNKKIVNVYCKQRLIPFIEYLPSWSPSVWSPLVWPPSIGLSGYFSSTTIQPCCFNIRNKYYRPLICSDIFIESFYDRLDQMPKIPLYNDTLFSPDYLYIMKTWCSII